MKKEEILEKSRQAHQDEGMQNAETKGREIGYIAFIILFAILAILCLLFWQMNAFYAISALFWTHYSAEWFSKYRFIKKKRHLIGFASAGIAAITFTIIFIVALFGVWA